MRIPFLYRFVASSFEALQKHADLVKESTWDFQQAMECYFSVECRDFNIFRKEIKKLESKADTLKRDIRDNLPINAFIPVDKFQFYRYLREQDKVLDVIEESLDWISYRNEPNISKALEKDFFILVESIIDPMEELSRLVAEAHRYFKKPTEKQRKKANDIIHTIRQQEHDADIIEDMLKQKVFTMETDPVTVFHVVRLAETIGSIADHAENAGAMMRAMLST